MSCLFADDKWACLLGHVPGPIQLAALLALLLFAAGVVWRLQDVLRFVYRIASWPGVAAAGGFIAFTVWYAFLRPRAPLGSAPKNPDGSPALPPRQGGRRRWNQDLNGGAGGFERY